MTLSSVVTRLGNSTEGFGGGMGGGRMHGGMNPGAFGENGVSGNFADFGGGMKGGISGNFGGRQGGMANFPPDMQGISGNEMRGPGGKGMQQTEEETTVSDGKSLSEFGADVRMELFASVIVLLAGLLFARRYK